MRDGARATLPVLAITVRQGTGWLFGSIARVCLGAVGAVAWLVTVSFVHAVVYVQDAIERVKRAA